MKISKELMERAGIKPKLRLNKKKAAGGVESTGPHRVKLISDRIVKGIDRDTGKEIELVEYTIEENGEQKIYEAKLKDRKGGLNYLVERLGEFPEGSEVILEGKRSGVKNYIDVSPVGSSIEVDDEDDGEVTTPPKAPN